MTPQDLITFDGTTQAISEWAADYGILPRTIVARLNAGYNVERAITEPMQAKAGERLPSAHKGPQGRKGALHEHNGQRLTVPQWAACTGLPRLLLYKRLRSGKTIGQAIALGRAQVGQPARMLTFDGITLSITEWASRLGVTKQALFRRLKLGWPLERIVAERNQAGANMIRCAALYEHAGERLTLKEWSERTGISANTLWTRLNKGWSTEKAITTPLGPTSPRKGAGVVGSSAEGAKGRRVPGTRDFPDITFLEAAE